MPCGNWPLTPPPSSLRPLCHPARGAPVDGPHRRVLGQRPGPFCESWELSSEDLVHGADGLKLSKISGLAAAHGRVLAGVEAAGIFESRDSGATWSLLNTLDGLPADHGFAAAARTRMIATASTSSRSTRATPAACPRAATCWRSAAAEAQQAGDARQPALTRLGEVPAQIALEPVRSLLGLAQQTASPAMLR